MISPRFTFMSKAAVTALAGGLLLSGCYYGYPPYPGYGSTTVPVTYTQREFAMPPGASGTAVANAPNVNPVALPPGYDYAVGPPTSAYYSDYYATPAYGAYPYAYPYPYAGYPAYYGYGGPSIALGFGYWGGGGCCWRGGGWNHGWHGGGGSHGGGGGWHGGGSSWQGGGGWHGGGGGGHGH